MKLYLSFFAVFAVLLLNTSCSFHTAGLTSPDNNLSVTVSGTPSGGLCYSFSAGGEMLIGDSPLGFRTADSVDFPGSDWSVSAEKRSHDGLWKPVWGKRQKVADRYNELVLTCKAPAGSKAGISIVRMVFRLYDDGAAFRYEVPEQVQDSVAIALENTRYNFMGNYTSWFYNGERANLGPDRLEEVDGIRRPVMTLKAADNCYMALHEADLIEGQPLLLASEKGEKAFRVASHPSGMKGGYRSAWRVVLYGKTPGTLVDSHLIELLNPDPEGDFSWVKPGVCVWDWRINGAVAPDGFVYRMDYPSWVRMVDFAAEQGFRALVLDANWYGPEFSKNSNPTSGSKTENVKRIIRYAGEKGVGVWLYLNDVGGRRFPLESTLKQYGDWGAAGVKYGFMRGKPEEKNYRTQEITRLCALNRLMVDFHDGPVHPYGQMRTWPNAVTREFCHAQLDGHHVFTPETFVTTVFVNMLAGPLDMNNGMFDLRQGPTTRVDENMPVPSTLVAEAARTLIVFSGATILPDIPEMYRKYPELTAFIAAQKMPWKESRTLAGEIGEYIVMMRETDTEYLIAAATDENPRTLSVPLTFLPAGTFRAELIQDGKDADYLSNRESYQTSTLKVTAADRIGIHMVAGGGACIRIFKK